MSSKPSPTDRDEQAAACTCGWPEKPCLRRVLDNGPPFPPEPCEPKVETSPAATTESPEPFQCEGFFTHYVCPKCSYNDWAEGDLRGDTVECEGCGFEGEVSQ